MHQSEFSILVVHPQSDEPGQLSELLRTQFSRAQVLHLRTPEKAVESAQLVDPSIIFVELSPQDERSLCTILKADPVTCDIPIVVVCQVDRTLADDQLALERGAEAFIRRPIRSAELSAQVAAMLKIKAAAQLRRRKNEQLASLVAERTRELEESRAAALSLLEALQEENDAKRRSEAALRESETHFRTLADSVPALIRSTDEEMQCDYCNHRWLHFTGGTLEAQLGEGWIGALHPDDRAPWLARFQAAASKRENYALSFRLRHHSGRYRWIEEIGCPRFDSRQAFVGYIMHGLDVHERRAVEIEREKLLAAIEQAGEAFCVTDEKGVIEYVNPAFERNSGYSRAELLGSNPRVLKSGKQHDAFYQRMWEKLLNRHTWTGQLVNRRKDGTLFTEEASISPVCDENGKIIHFVAVKRDITQQIALSEQLLAAQKMEAIGRLAGGVAHDFNNHLAVILGYLGFAGEGLREGDPLKEDLDEIRKAAESAKGLIRQLLAFSRKQVLEPQVIDLNEIVKGLERILRRLISEDVELVLELGERIGRVLADPGQIEQVIMNLVINARDAIQGDGRVVLQTSRTSVGESDALRHPGLRPGDFVLLSVCDSGTGMDANTLEHIFEPFFSTKEKGKGTGLGLSTVHGIVKQSGGEVLVESELGRGSCFRVLLPRVAEGFGRMRTRTPIKRPRFGHETVLLVEDDPSVRKVAVRTLRRLGYQVLPAANGGEALLLCERFEGQIHLLITDVVMPRMSGPELADRLRLLKPQLPVLFMSGYTDDAIAHHGIHDPTLNLLQKPFNAQELSAKIREILDT
ncbi:MAG: PAS domain S-box protein [Myxococcota bacterium]|jgi:PAS domain S-box-containing protein|nr:PAS domain S-box protein [Myxococcota bacterium]